MTKRPKCKTRGCSHRAAAKPSIKAYGYCGGCYEADTTRREWEVRAAESWKVGRDVGRSTALADVTRAITELGVDVPTDALPLVMDIADMIAKADRESHATGREAGLREAAEACDAQAESWPESPESWFADPGMRHEAVTRRAHRNEAKSCAAKIRRALAPPAAETPPAGVGHALSLGVCCAACYRDGKHSAPFRPMILCPKCGNKRCPRAGSHANACTNSNEPGQVATPAADPRDEGES